MRPREGSIAAINPSMTTGVQIAVMIETLVPRLRVAPATRIQGMPRRRRIELLRASLVQPPSPDPHRCRHRLGKRRQTRPRGDEARPSSSAVGATAAAAPGRAGAGPGPPGRQHPPCPNLQSGHPLPQQCANSGSTSPSSGRSDARAGGESGRGPLMSASPDPGQASPAVPGCCVLPFTGARDRLHGPVRARAARGAAGLALAREQPDAAVEERRFRTNALVLCCGVGTERPARHVLRRVVLERAWRGRRVRCRLFLNGGAVRRPRSTKAL
jgi:hypothetical protein